MNRMRHADWLRVLHGIAALSVLLAVCGPALQPSQVLAAAPETVSATALAAVPLRPSLTFQTTLPQWLTGQSAQGEITSTLPDTPATDPQDPQPQLPHRPPVWLDVSANPVPANAGDTLTLSIRVNVDGNIPGGMLTAVLPKGVAFVAGKDGGTYDATARAIRWLVPTTSAQQSPEFHFQARISDDAPDLMVQGLSLWVPGYSGPATGQVVLKRLFPPTGASVTPDAGGALRSADGRVQVIFPPGAVSQPVRVEHAPVQVDLLPAQRGGLALQFELNAYTDDEAAAPIHKFAKPLELRVDMTGLVNWDDLAPWQYPFLGYLDEKTGEWMPLPARREGNVLVAQLDHFSTLGGGAGNVYETGWLLAFNDAHVSTFTGGLNYDFPIQVPEGRGGLTPDLRLNYNSRRVDGVLTWIQTDWAGLGWTLDTMSIARKVTPDYTPTNGRPAWYWGPWVAWENKFTLLYKGTGYKLVPGSTSAYGRYYTEDEQFLYIERRNDAGGNGSPGNATGEYWVVRLRDGTEYRLGYRTDSEQIVATNSYTVPTTPAETTYAGRANGQVAFQWRVDAITDTHGNSIEFL